LKHFVALECGANFARGAEVFPLSKVKRFFLGAKESGFTTSEELIGLFRTEECRSGAVIRVASGFLFDGTSRGDTDHLGLVGQTVIACH
jgi:hypothetical protein